jgi:two-component system, cell cycle sensor histidine kinase and response regulator CckA
MAGTTRDEPGASSCGSILVVHDDPLVLTMFCTILRALGYSVTEATSGAEALDKFAATGREICLLVTDTVMPQMNGIELASEIKRHAPGVKVLYVSGYALSVLASAGYDVEQVDAFLQKPLVPAILANRVRELLT